MLRMLVAFSTWTGKRTYQRYDLRGIYQAASADGDQQVCVQVLNLLCDVNALGPQCVRCHASAHADDLAG